LRGNKFHLEIRNAPHPERGGDDDDDSKSYVRPLLEAVTSVLVIRSDKQFGFQITAGRQTRDGLGKTSHFLALNVNVSKIAGDMTKATVSD